MEALVHVCQFYFPDHVHFENEFTNESIYDTINDLSLTINDTLFNCNWKNKMRDCSQTFSPVLTDLGRCFTFNSPNSDEIFTERCDFFSLNHGWTWRVVGDCITGLLNVCFVYLQI